MRPAISRRSTDRTSIVCGVASRVVSSSGIGDLRGGGLRVGDLVSACDRWESFVPADLILGKETGSQADLVRLVAGFDVGSQELGDVETGSFAADQEAGEGLFDPFEVGGAESPGDEQAEQGFGRAVGE